MAESRVIRNSGRNEFLGSEKWETGCVCCDTMRTPECPSCATVLRTRIDHPKGIGSTFPQENDCAVCVSPTKGKDLPPEQMRQWKDGKLTFTLCHATQITEKTMGTLSHGKEPSQCGSQLHQNDRVVFPSMFVGGKDHHVWATADI